MSFDIRENRLRNDYHRIQKLVDRSDFIHIVSTEGSPPEKYLIRYTCKGVKQLGAGNQPEYSDVHEVAIYLHAEYPLKQPQLKWKTPMFHPNIHVTGAVCIGAWWPAKFLDDLLLSMGEMVQYKNYDPRDPMNSRAAAWALRNKQLFPVDKRPLKGASIADMIKLGDTEEQDDGLSINFL